MQKKGRAGTSRAGKIALYGMMTALAFLLSYVETLIPINLGVPGVKLGLANLASIVSLYLLGAGAAAAIALVRIVLVGFTFGNLSMMLYSLAGAAVSLLLMVVFRRLDWFGVTGVSILGGAGHNIGQLIVAALVVENASLFYYLPVLLAAGTAAGAKEELKKEGLTTETVNASQKFVKAHPSTQIYEKYSRQYTAIIHSLIEYLPPKEKEKVDRLAALRDE